ncbi:hypothetical protein [Microbacterium candidum]|uniref:Phage holin family protein n=1 Tax=Microbacterium candidum TaxID=3041922 RepID=A0ABT7MWW9_9MICO|nr:hypothetical protein [Microbacterium sp. ASV49]MDL9978951.1 hypothetical protein [Microbacterium sp. ASV49]
MKAWVVRFASLYVFDVVVLLLIGAILPSVRVGWAALWASVILTALTVWIKPALTNGFRKRAAKTARDRTKAGEAVVQGVLVFLVELLVWLVVVWFSGVRVTGFFWGYVLPPLFLLVAWAIYSAIDDRIEARAGALYDRSTGAETDAVDPPHPRSSS